MNAKNFVTTALLVASTFGLTACLGGMFEPKEDQTVFYMMRPTAEKSVSQKRIAVNMMPITIPQYMSRNNIVTLASDGTVEISEFDRWAEAPQGGFERTLLENLSRNGIDAFSYPAVSRGAPNLKIYVYDCIATLGGNFLFKGKWQLDSSDATKSVSRDFVFDKPCGKSYADFVKGVDCALAALSSDIAQTISKNTTSTK